MSQFVHKFGEFDSELKGTRQHCLSAYSVPRTVPNALLVLLQIICPGNSVGWAFYPLHCK